jgi:hypothetical protein
MRLGLTVFGFGSGPEDRLAFALSLRRASSAEGVLTLCGMVP